MQCGWHDVGSPIPGGPVIGVAGANVSCGEHETGHHRLSLERPFIYMDAWQ